LTERAIDKTISKANFYLLASINFNLIFHSDPLAIEERNED
jgi:hypothetical protein